MTRPDKQSETNNDAEIEAKQPETSKNSDKHKRESTSAEQSPQTERVPLSQSEKQAIASRPEQKEQSESKNEVEKQAATNDESKHVDPQPVAKHWCRICLFQTPPLITPCECRAAFAYVHTKCLNEWLDATQVEQCDICRFKFKLRKRRKNIVEWLKDEGKFTEYADEIREHCFSAFVFMLGIAIAFISKCR